MTALLAAGEAALAQAARRPNVPVIAGVFAFAGVLVLVFAVATGWVGRPRPPAPEEAEELEPVVAGIRLGSGAVPRWLYAIYLLIPAWALLYLANGARVRGELVPTPRPAGEAQAAAPATPGAPAAGGPVAITAKNVAFNVKEFSLRAGQPAVIRFRNNDAGVPHNVAIYPDQATARANGPALFKGEIFPGVATREYRFTAPPAGTYYFQCDVHPAMNGTVKVT